MTTAPTEFVRDPFRVRQKPCKDERFYRQWSAARAFCYACGGPGDFRGLQTHHIVKQGRSHEACNLVRLCARCHELAEGLDVRGPAKTVYLRRGRRVIEERGLGDLLPKLTIGMCLTLKAMHDPDEVDLSRLQELRGSRLPDPEPVPEFFTREYQRNRGGAT